MNGVEISRRYYLSSVAPGLRGVRHAAALLGPGSEVLGYDDEVSPDHDFGERVQIFGPGHESAGEFFAALLGFDPADGVTVADWLLTPTQIFASLTRGAVFHDPDGELANRRAAIAWYPDDVWRYALAAGWLKVSQEEAFVARTGAAGDEIGSRILAARLARELMRLAFLVERRWAPYAKWFGRAFGELSLAATLAAPLRAAMAAEGWREREEMICTAGSTLAAATNALGLCPELDPSPRPFYTRDIRVLAGDRFTVALTAEITDPVLLGVVGRAGRRQQIPKLPGTIDQAVDSTDILGNTERFRAAGLLLGLG
ncbi:DUF4037 domain-containing protein [Paractinoplanes rhizophilus]|uniref:DUF4037 domain-containing protein n=1 Tax=Paractinoplanes rhizophilus TaxID=1416877 RepID=A0ABW2HKQ3_9ACTN|nr:DUF4037 domain-containing protein [Actinoplanes sp.]